MSHTRKTDTAYLTLVERQARDHLIIALVAVFALISLCGAVGFDRVKRAYEIAGRV